MTFILSDNVLVFRKNAFFPFFSLQRRGARSQQRTGSIGEFFKIIFAALKAQKMITEFIKIYLKFQTAETVETIVTQLMEKQRCARAAALSGKSLDCPGCNDPNQECSLHHVPGKPQIYSGVRNKIRSLPFLSSKILGAFFDDLKKA